MKFETISVVGLGYIGLPTAALFASYGLNVIGVDVSENVVDTINRGEIHIIEPDLDELVRAGVQQKKLRAVAKPEPADAFLIAVPTPFKTDEKDTPEPDLSFIQAACYAIAPLLRKGNLVILESTSPVGATEQVCSWLSEMRPDLIQPNSTDLTPDIFVAHCPERVLPGRVIYELINNDRIIGGITESCSQAAARLYKIFVQGECHITNSRTAEMAKLTENASRDVQIAFANELSIICDNLDINTRELIELANKHPRVSILNPGPGVGGHCIAVDPWFIVNSDPENSKIIRAAREGNDRKPLWVVDKIVNEWEKEKNKRIVLFGATYKENIDDVRESPSIKIAKCLSALIKADILFVEPNIDKDEIENFTNLKQIDVDFKQDICVFLVKHSEFFPIINKADNCMDFVGMI